jgi:hypothetical protein
MVGDYIKYKLFVDGKPIGNERKVIKINDTEYIEQWIAFNKPKIGLGNIDVIHRLIINRDIFILESVGEW